MNKSIHMSKYNLVNMSGITCIHMISGLIKWYWKTNYRAPSWVDVFLPFCAILNCLYVCLFSVGGFLEISLFHISLNSLV